MYIKKICRGLLEANVLHAGHFFKKQKKQRRTHDVVHECNGKLITQLTEDELNCIKKSVQVVY